MTYTQFIAQVNLNLREAEAWPESPATQDQVDRSYAAILAVAMRTPLERLPKVETTLTPSGTALIKADLPATIFSLRSDLGIKYFEFDTGRIKFIEQAVPYQTIERSAVNEWQNGNLLFTVDTAANSVWYCGASTVKLNHAVYPAKPLIANIGSTNVPLNGTDIEQAVQLVVAHVSGTTVKNPSASQFAILMNQLYQGVGATNG
jgi:hypothetical protein